MKAFPLLLLLTMLFTFSLADDINLDETGWPKEVKFKKGIVTIYQPQIEEFKDDKIQARAAFSATPKGKQAIFGAMWFSSRVQTDTDERLVRFDNIVIEDFKFPEGDDGQVKKLRRALSERLTGLGMIMSLDRFIAELEILKKEWSGQSDQFKHDPPDIYFETTPAVLVYIDGDPILKDVENTSVEYVVNTPYFLVHEKSSKKYYLKGGKWWYTSNNVIAGWKSIDKPPKDIRKMADKAFEGQETEMDSLANELKEPPKVIVSTKPAELIQTDGKPEMKPVKGTDLLFLTNSESDILMDINSQQYYILISGRWYRSKQLDTNTWEFVDPKKLPEEFKKIPPDSDIADVLYNVPGTEQSREAILQNSIPQTAEIDRKTAKVEVSYDGDPEFKKIESTSISYAVNSDKTVLLIDGKYYCVDEGVWFVAPKATGNWEVCVEVPEEVKDIPPSSPAYNVKYVYVYDYTPEVVYVAYTPGYYGSYVYGGTVIYGTGYWYRPWYHHYYYPRPVTFGFGVHYNPWTGWGFSFGVSYGWLSFGWHSHGHYGWWGPAGYRYGYRHGYYHGYRHGYYHGARAGYRAGYHAGRYNNIYRTRPTGVVRTGTPHPSTRPVSRPSTRPSTKPSTRPVTKPTTRPAQKGKPTTRPANPSVGGKPSDRSARPKTKDNNVYTDKSGNIYRRDKSGSWQQRQNGQWNRVGTTQQNRSKAQPNLNRQYQSRQRGATRTNAYRNRAGGMRRR